MAEVEVAAQCRAAASVGLPPLCAGKGTCCCCRARHAAPVVAGCRRTLAQHAAPAVPAAPAPPHNMLRPPARRAPRRCRPSRSPSAPSGTGTACWRRWRCVGMLVCCIATDTVWLVRGAAHSRVLEQMALCVTDCVWLAGLVGCACACGWSWRIGCSTHCSGAGGDGGACACSCVAYQ